MPTFAIEIAPPKRNGTRPICLRITQHRQLRRLTTSLGIAAGGYDKQGHIHSKVCALQVDELLRQCVEWANELGYTASSE